MQSCKHNAIKEACYFCKLIAKAIRQEKREQRLLEKLYR